MSDPPRPPRWAALCSFAVPASLALACAGNGMGFYDSPELAAAGGGLAVTHPPGHPVWSALAAVCSLVPVGALPFRIALGEALCLGGISLLALHAAFGLFVRVAGPHGPRVAPWAALAAALTATLGTGVFRQATRVEVYALAGLVTVGLLALALDRERPASMRLREGALMLGLGLANHHFIAITAAPLMLWIASERWREQRAGRVRSVLVSAAFVLPGLAVYAVLPLRARALASLARVQSPGDFIDVVSARVFMKNTGLGVPGSTGVRALDVLDWMGETLTPVGLLFAVGGLYAAVRTQDARREAWRVLTLVGVVTVARGWLGFVRDNPDAAGYLVPAFAALGVLGAAFTGAAVRALAEAPLAPQGPSRPARILLAVLLVGGPLALPVFLGARSVQASSVDRSTAPATLAAAALSQLPPRTVLFAYDPQTVFRLRYAMLVDGERPDVTVVPVPLLGYPGMIDHLMTRSRGLAPLLTEYVLRPDRGLSARGLSNLAVSHPVFVEIDPRNVRDSVATLLPRGVVAQQMPEPTTLAAVRGAAAGHFARMDQLASLLAREGSARTLVDEAMLWHAYTSALYFAARGARPEARRALDAASHIAPDASELEALRLALATPGEGPIDVSPFLTR
ncbi:MAG: DUF2723 domain-containing protein [Deltaproteobacteria bacterium]